jgi:hypothetical protein
MTIGELIYILSKLPEEVEIDIFKSVYLGGDSELRISDIAVVLFDSSVSIMPQEDVCLLDALYQGFPSPEIVTVNS